MLVRALPMLCVTAAFLMASAAPTPVEAASAHKKYLKAWEKQLEQYKTEYVQQEQVLRASGSRAFADHFAASAATTSETDYWAGVGRISFQYAVAIQELRVIAGRGETIKAFIAHMKEKPTAGLSDVWFQQQLEFVNREAQRADRQNAEFLVALEKQSKTGFVLNEHGMPTWLTALDYVAQSRGTVVGRYQELQSLYQQALKYYGDMAQRQIEVAQRAQAFAALGNMLLNMSYQQQLLDTLNRPRTCTRIGHTTTCF